MSPGFGSTHPNEPEQSNVHIYQNHGPFLDCIEGPLSSRGWTLQERELSPRILHYTKGQVLWECRECTASETSPKLEPKSPKQLGGVNGAHSSGCAFTSFSLISSDQLAILKQWRLLDQTSGQGVEAVMGKWYALIEGYSRRQLTVKRDKLPAISGMAAEVARMNGGAAYAAGLWKDDVLRGLSWFPDPVLRRVAKRREWPPPRSDDDIPSWSWAAFDGPITHCGEEWFHGHVGRKPVRPAALLHLETTPASRDPFGRVSGGVIGLSGWAVEASVSEALYDPDARAVTFRAKCYRLPASFRYPPTLRLYFDADAEELPQISVLCLRLGNGLSPRRAYGDVGLVLMRVDAGNKFRRVGMFDVETVDQIWVSRRVETSVDIV